jgi:hypothetical protein
MAVAVAHPAIGGEEEGRDDQDHDGEADQEGNQNRAAVRFHVANLNRINAGVTRPAKTGA